MGETVFHVGRLIALHIIIMKGKWCERRDGEGINSCVLHLKKLKEVNLDVHPTLCYIGYHSFMTLKVCLESPGVFIPFCAIRMSVSS